MFKAKVCESKPPMIQLSILSDCSVLHEYWLSHSIQVNAVVPTYSPDPDAMAQSSFSKQWDPCALHGLWKQAFGSGRYVYREMSPKNKDRPKVCSLTGKVRSMSSGWEHVTICNTLSCKAVTIKRDILVSIFKQQWGELIFKFSSKNFSADDCP